jgi:[acyl-carrier-protein] S-malonyltransferase
MGRELSEGFDIIDALYEEANETLGYDLRGVSFSGPEEELNRTVKTQPCLLAAGIAAFSALSLNGVRPDAVAGHSLGEYTALVASEVLSFRDALSLTELRATLMQEAVPDGSGMMAAVMGLDRKTVNEVCGAVDSGYVAAANYNCPGQIVISGLREAVEEAVEALKDAGAKRVIPLSVSVPSHCMLMEGASKKLSEFLFLGDMQMKEPRVPIVCNSDAIFLSSVEGIKAALVKQLSGPVLWENSVISMTEAGIDTFVEVGPGKVLSGLVKRINRDARTLNVQDMESLENTLKELA